MLDCNGDFSLAMYFITEETGKVISGFGYTNGIFSSGNLLWSNCIDMCEAWKTMHRNVT